MIAREELFFLKEDISSYHSERLGEGAILNYDEVVPGHHWECIQASGVDYF